MIWKIIAILITAFYLGIHIAEKAISNSPRMAMDRELEKWTWNEPGHIYLSTCTHGRKELYVLILSSSPEVPKYVKGF